MEAFDGIQSVQMCLNVTAYVPFQLALMLATKTHNAVKSSIFWDIRPCSRLNFARLQGIMSQETEPQDPS
jgi:hypothetical protein